MSRERSSLARNAAASRERSSFLLDARKVLPKVEIRMLAARTPIKRQGWWKVCFILEASNLGVGVGWTPFQKLTPPTDNHWARDFIDLL